MATDPGDISRRRLLIGLVAVGASGVALPTVTACAGGMPGSLRRRIVTGLTAQDSDSLADIVSSRATELTVVNLPEVPDWQLVDVRNNEMSHPYRTFLAVTRADEVEVVVLSDFPDRWPQILAGARVPDADAAVRVATTHYDVTRTMGVWCYRVESFDEIEFHSGADVDQVAALREEFADRIGPPEPEAVEDGWTMTVWAQENDGELVERRTIVGTDADVTIERTVHADDLPVPISI